MGLTTVRSDMEKMLPAPASLGTKLRGSLGFYRRSAASGRGVHRQEKLPAKSIWRATLCTTRFPAVACAEGTSCPPSDARVRVEKLVIGWDPKGVGRRCEAKECH